MFVTIEKVKNISKGLVFDKSSKNLITLMILTDIIFMILHVLHFAKLVESPLFYISRDLGYAEMFQYIKEFWIVILLLMIAKDKGKVIYLAWALVFLYILLDDSLKIHETFGEHLVNHFDLQPFIGLRAKDFGELITSALFGVFLFSFLGWSYFKSDIESRMNSSILFILFTLLVFFGVFIDMMGIILHGPSILNHIIILLEDGGEMIIMSIIVGYSFTLINKCSESYSMNG